MKYALKVKEQREAHGWTQRQLAEKLGLDKSTVAHWETHRKKPELGNLMAMAALFGCALDDLCGREPPGTTQAS